MRKASILYIILMSINIMFICINFVKWFDYTEKQEATERRQYFIEHPDNHKCFPNIKCYELYKCYNGICKYRNDTLKPCTLDNWYDVSDESCNISRNDNNKIFCMMLLILTILNMFISELILPESGEGVSAIQNTIHNRIDLFNLCLKLPQVALLT
jgi:hypothetical protein